ncbi:hypothetical protein ITP53_43535 [Nonomuraea sp. K274]|uniref:Uncharacterized protein n=1 Tax=Nonomuraea cypriaca TaxID=1187855 RepID=A0A931F497_9ACTN|nr:hypothetical protein [Nonomuraea cypriaca]MBF8192442.1 hypothetical protein [Nonomuraea cypriaca]
MTTLLAWLMSAAVLALASFRPTAPTEARRAGEIVTTVRAAGFARCALGALVALAVVLLYVLADLIRITRAAALGAAKAADWLAAWIETLWADAQARRNTLTLEVVK